MQSRKKRRGIIEKRRRDRINNSLSDLRSLIPTAREKQGSAKLEKAEILQMTVEYVKMLHSKGGNPLACDPSKMAMDYRNFGFQECISEVSKCLSIEGIDPQNSLWKRLMSHLQSVMNTKQSLWYPTAAPPPPPPPPPPNASQFYPSYTSLSPHVARPPPPPLPAVASELNVAAAVAVHHNASLNSSSGSSLELSGSSLNSSASHSHSLNSSFENATTNSGGGAGAATNCDATPPSTTNSSSTASAASVLTTVTSTADGYSYLHHNQHPSMELYHHHHAQHLVHQQQGGYGHPVDPSVSTQMKQPYRPWGTECAY